MKIFLKLSLSCACVCVWGGGGGGGHTHMSMCAAACQPVYKHVSVCRLVCVNVCTNVSVYAPVCVSVCTCMHHLVPVHVSVSVYFFQKRHCQCSRLHHILSTFFLRHLLYYVTMMKCHSESLTPPPSPTPLHSTLVSLVAQISGQPVICRI